MERSFLSTVSSREPRAPPRDSFYELPRWRSPSPMAASIIPPPIVQSMHSLPSQAISQSVVIEKPAPLVNRESELEADLQFLLDAQAEGLTKGLQDGLNDDHVSTGSTTPTATSFRDTYGPRVSRPLRKRLGLRSARKGIYRNMVALSTVKDEELQEVNEAAREGEETLRKIDEWSEKRRSLGKASSNAGSDEDSVRVQRLQREANTLQSEINSVELQLADMKSRHKKLLRQIAAVENEVQARVASYDSSLRMLNEDVEKFLSSEPPGIDAQRSIESGQTSIWRLPPKRRTLELARQYWSDEHDATIRQRQSIEHERSALIEGATIWKDVVARVTELERRLRAGISNSPTSSNPDSAWDDPSQSKPSKENLANILGHMDSLIESLDSSFALATERHWNLLIAAIGAEVDALKQGRELLQKALQAGSKQSHPLESLDLNNSESSGGKEISDPDRTFETTREQMTTTNNIVDSEDDPDPELLFSMREDSAD